MAIFTWQKAWSWWPFCFGQSSVGKETSERAKVATAQAKSRKTSDARRGKKRAPAKSVKQSSRKAKAELSHEAPSTELKANLTTSFQKPRCPCLLLF